MDMLLPNDLLHQLKCILCKLHLSIFPIYVDLKGTYPICGRCQIPSEDKYIRDHAYENLAQFILFPCTYASKEQTCPSSTYTKCLWRGYIDSLKSHFEQYHESLLIKTGQFLLDIDNNIKENMIMLYKNEMFVIKKEIDSISGYFFCWVNHLIRNEEPSPYSYSLRFECDQETVYTSPLRSTSLNDCSTLSLDFIRETLNNPSTVVVRIVLSNENDNIKPLKSIRNSTVDWELLESLECPICTEYMHRPIYQCVKGHSICSKCKPKLQNCGICKHEIKDTQNFSLSQIADRLIYPCKYYTDGCDSALTASKIKEHESTCLYGSYKCPLRSITSCKERFPENDIRSHIESTHSQFVLKTELVNVPFQDEVQDLSERYIVIFASKLFKLYFKYENGKFFWTFQLIGPVEECSQYKFEIDILDNSGNNLRQYARGPCVQFTPDEDNAFVKKGTYVVFLHDQIANFITTTLSYRIKVIKE
ncbi:hypothetical protein GWI33_008596 [Rhynchophorus ferrugineus]|uniref:RING-type E3 ubiquitin transferase n=1 Tax=Rhynchophorus ferrugineus TaxID=354439 RepID=A0A834IEG9_RHYFE|nr:hypothetical protein GWI33_008596 [Rhynchophorus ferrugineus]